MNSLNQSFSLKDLTREQVIAVLMLLGFAFYMIWDQFHWWSTREDYSFGFLVPLFAVYVIHDRWPLIMSYLACGDIRLVDESVKQKTASQSRWVEWIAGTVFLGGISLFAIGALLRSVTGPQNPASLAIAVGFSGLMLSTVFIMVKERLDGEVIPLKNRLGFTGLFLFPTMVWLISAPLVSVLETKVRVFLLTKVTIVVFTLFDIMGFEIEREGNVLFLPQGRVGVEEACSGIYSLTACIFVGTFLAAVFLDRFWKKVLLVLAAMLLAILTNLMRSLFLTSWAYFYGPGAINDSWILPLIGDIGTVHDVMGLAVLGITSICLLLMLPVFNFKLKAFDDLTDKDVPKK
ncbi:MAG: exosortase [Lentimonas sp.]